MTRLSNFIKSNKNGFLILSAFILIILVEVFGFNRDSLFSAILNLEERHYSVNQGTLFQFDQVNGKLIAKNYDPNITFDQVNLRVSAVSVKCTNSMPGAVGQIYYRDNLPYSEQNSVKYDASSVDKTIFLGRILGFPKAVAVSSLRFDLTLTQGDIISCSEFVINPRIPFNLNPIRLAVYTGLFLLTGLFAVLKMRTRLNRLIKENKKEFLVLGVFILVILVELYGFNRDSIFSAILNLEERHYSVNQGSLFQFNQVNGKLIAKNYDPNITFDQVNLRVGAVLVKCTNSMPGAVGQIYYRDNLPYSEQNSVKYDASSVDKTIFLERILGFPKVVNVSSLRFDLTLTQGDIISCSEFVINPRIPFNVDFLRLVIYIGLIFFTVLYIYRNVNPGKYRKIIFTCIFLALSFVLCAKLMPFAISNNVVFLVTLCVMLFSGAITYALVYIFKDFRPENNEKIGVFDQFKYEIGLVIVLILTTLPFLTEPYFYFDDWWNVGRMDWISQKTLLTFGRPLQILFFVVFDNIHIQNAYAFKWVFLFAVILFAILLYRWLVEKTQDKTFSFILAGILSLFAPVMDLIGCSASGAVTFSLLFAALSVVCFDQAHEAYQHRQIGRFVICLAITFFLIFTACLIYQIGPQIVFVFFAIEIYFGIKPVAIIKKDFAYLLIFAIANGFYLIYLKVINQLYNATITTNRSQILHSIPEVVAKLQFYRVVIEQSAMQVVTAFTGNVFVLERYHGYFVTFSDQLVGNGIFFFVICMILISFVGYWLRTKSFIGLFALVIFIPMSYYAFLILSENGYLTYYAFAHISIFMFYFLMGFIVTAQFVRRIPSLILKKKTDTGRVNPSTIIAPLLVICAFISNYYIRDFYINFNSTVYNFVKYSLQTGIEFGNIKRIHVNGSISPLNADVYSQFIVETALKDLGKNVRDYEIAFSGNKYFLASIPEAEYQKILGHVSAADKLELEKIYIFRTAYRQYDIKTWPSEYDQKILQQIFIRAGLIPQSNSPGTLIIDITWTVQAYYNH